MPGDPQKQKKQVDDAAKQAGLDREQRKKLGREVERQTREMQENLDYQDILELARDIKGKLL